LARLRHVVTLRDGTPVLLRPIEPDDKAVLTVGMTRLSIETRRRRFFAPVQRLSDEQLRFFTEIDYVDHFAWIAFLTEGAVSPDAEGPSPQSPTRQTSHAPQSPTNGLAVARYIRRADRPDAAEYAIVVVDEYQGRGLGSILLVELGKVAYRNGIRHFLGSVLSDNRAMLNVAHDLGATTQYDGSGVTLVSVELTEDFADRRDHPVYALLRRAARREAAAPGAVSSDAEGHSPHH
jgi:GNAT superfamily N-acetyltransferase